MTLLFSAAMFNFVSTLSGVVRGNTSEKLLRFYQTLSIHDTEVCHIREREGYPEIITNRFFAHSKSTTSSLNKRSPFTVKLNK